MRHLSIVTVALVATAIDSASPASAHACIKNEYGRVVCGPVAARYPGGRYDDRYDQAASPIGYCPQAPWPEITHAYPGVLRWVPNVRRTGGWWTASADRTAIP